MDYIASEFLLTYFHIISVCFYKLEFLGSICLQIFPIFSHIAILDKLSLNNYGLVM